MRLRKQDIHQRINGNLHVQFARQSITSYSGLELICRYFRLIGLNRRITKGLEGFSNGAYSSTDFVLVFVALWLCGGRRLFHVRYICEDPLVKRLCGLKTLPSDRTLSRWLGQFTHDSLQCLAELNSELITDKLEQLNPATLTLDFDGTVLSCGNRVKWAFRGYNPMNRHAKSYFPLLCHIAQTGHFLQVKNRPGNTHDSKGGALGVIQTCINQIKLQFPRVRIEVRMDAAFFSKDIVQYLMRNRIDFVVKVPMWKWLGIKEKINGRRRWFRYGKKLAWFKSDIVVKKWQQDLELTIFREKISDKPPKHYQLDLFTPDDGVYEYSVLCTNKTLSPPRLLTFYNGRCAMEKNISELKGEFAFASIPTQEYQANSAHQHLSILTYNLMRNFQLDSGMCQVRKRNGSRTSLFRFESLRTLRFKWIAVAGRLLNLAQGKTLRIDQNEQRQSHWQRTLTALDRLQAA